MPNGSRQTHSRRRVLQQTSTILGLITTAGCNQASEPATDSSTKTLSERHGKTQTETPRDTPTETKSETPTKTEIPEPSLTDGVTLKWTVVAGPSVTPTVYDDSVLIGDDSGTLSSLLRSDGSVRWQTEIAGGFQREIGGRASVSDGTVFAGTASGLVTAIDLQTGEIRWSTDTKSRISNKPISQGGTLYLVGIKGDVTALDPADGTIRWTKQASVSANTFVDGDPAITDERIFLTTDTVITARRLDDWEVAWQKELGSSTHSVHADRRVFFGTGTGIRAADAVTGDTVWDYDIGAAPTGLSKVESGVISAGFEDGQIHLLNVADGNRRWKSDIDGEMFDDPIIDSGRVYATTESGGVYSLDQTDGSRIWSADVRSDADISTAGDFLAAGTKEGAVFALQEE